MSKTFSFDNNDFQASSALTRSPDMEQLDMKMQGRRLMRNSAKIELGRIITRDQVREDFDPDELQQLADSLKSKGQQQPIRVWWDAAAERYVLLMGERRYRAAKMNNWHEIECIIHEKELNEAEITELQLIENIVRADLNPIEEAKAFRKIMDDRKAAGKPATAKDLAKELGYSDTKVARSVRLLTLPDDIQKDVANKTIPPSVIREVLKLKRDDEQRKMLTDYKGGLSYADIAGTVKDKKSGKGGQSSSPKTKKVFSANGIKVQAVAKKKATQAEIAEVLELWLSELRNDGRSKAA